MDWLIEKSKAGYQMVNSVQRLQEIMALIRMASGADLKRLGWNGDGSGGNGNIAQRLVDTRGIVQDANGELRFAEFGVWRCCLSPFSTPITVSDRCKNFMEWKLRVDDQVLMGRALC